MTITQQITASNRKFSNQTRALISNIPHRLTHCIPLKITHCLQHSFAITSALAELVAGPSIPWQVPASTQVNADHEYLTDDVRLMTRMAINDRRPNFSAWFSLQQSGSAVAQPL